MNNQKIGGMYQELKLTYWWLFQFLIIFTRSQLTVDIAFSPFTHIELLSNLTVVLEEKFNGQLEFNQVFVERIFDIEKFSEDIILDLTFSTSFSENIKEYANKNNAIMVSIDKPSIQYSDTQFFVHNSWKNQFKALFSIISYLNWKKFIVISDEINKENDEFFSYFSNKIYYWYYFSNSNNENSADLFIGKIIQPTGIKNIVILSQGESTKLLLKSLENHKLLSLGTGVIVGSEGVWNLYGNGIIGFSEFGLEAADDYYSYQTLAVIKFLEFLLKIPSSDPFELLDFLDKNTIDHHPVSNFTLINIKNNQKIAVGNIFNGNLSIFNTITYPGNSLIIPNSPISEINIWIANGTTNPGTSPDIAVQSIANGAFFALSTWNSAHSLENFEITVSPTDCGAAVFDQSYGLSCFSSLLTTPGVGFITSPYWYMSISYIYTLRYLNSSIPSISAYSSSSILQNQTNFPEFMTVIKDEKFNTQVILNLAVIFGWKNLVVIHDDASEETYEYFIEKVEDFNMNIVNGKELRKIDTYYTLDQYSKWEYWFKSIISLKARLFVIFLTPPYWFHVVQSFYDTGLRRGDVLFLSNSRIAYSLIWETDLKQRQKLIELLYGTFIIAQAEWIGEYGKNLKNDFIKKYTLGTDFRCLAFDATTLLLNGIKFTIEQGENVKNNEIMNKNMRRQRFNGCSETVSIESGGNQRSLPTLGIYNLRWDNSANSLYEELVGTYDASSVQLIKFYSDIIWYDNTTNTPTDLIIYENGCPFPAKKIFRSEKGAGILYGITIGLVLITIFEMIYIWKKFWKYIKIEKLIRPARVHFEDYIIISVLIIDFFQFISQGPVISGLFYWLSWLCNYSMLHFNSDVAGATYWFYLYCAMIISCYWIISACLLIFSQFQILNYIRDLIILMLPIIGNMIFLPMISVLLSIFQCDKGIGESITDSFIKNDCNTYCWDNSYILWGGFSIISLMTYIPLATYFRIYYEYISHHINIKTKPIFILEKTVFQITIVVMNKTIKIYDESLHGLCCIIMILIFIVICIKQRPYNYDRVNLWLIISYLAIMWNFILSGLYWFTKFESVLWLVLQFSVWIILIIVGAIIQQMKIPSLLLTAKSTNIAIFFKFSMGSHIPANEINKIKKEIVESNYFIEENRHNAGDQSYNSADRLN